MIAMTRPLGDAPLAQPMRQWRAGVVDVVACRMRAIGTPSSHVPVHLTTPTRFRRADLAQRVESGKQENRAMVRASKYLRSGFPLSEVLCSEYH
jgi:hypothetical protein